MTVKVRRVRYYHPYGGTWYRVQVKFLFFWWTSPVVYTSEKMAEQAMRYVDEVFDKPVKKVVYETFKKNLMEDSCALCMWCYLCRRPNKQAATCNDYKLYMPQIKIRYE